MNSNDKGKQMQDYIDLDRIFKKIRANIHIFNETFCLKKIGLHFDKTNNLGDIYVFNIDSDENLMLYVEYDGCKCLFNKNEINNSINNDAKISYYEFSKIKVDKYNSLLYSDSEENKLYSEESNLLRVLLQYFRKKMILMHGLNVTKALKNQAVSRRESSF